ncbi:MAG: ATP-binding protein [Deltaproteobacteria bacterium]|nr:ATP-binding protein [Deltaproteobacteria bacterium]
MYKRILSRSLPSLSFFLFGPRQVGKTTLLRDIRPSLAVDLLQPEIQLQYSKDPSLLARQVQALPQDPEKQIILIDEVQKVPRLLDVVHSLMESNPTLQFILCGSSARKLRHGAANLLGGRAVYRSLFPLTITELGGDFRLETAVQYGTLPKIAHLLAHRELEAAKDLLHAYVITYLQEEIKAEALVRSLHGFQNFLDIAASQFSQPVNYSDIGRDCDVAYTTVRDYYSILEDTLIGFFLRPYLKSERKRMSHSPKFYFFDNGVTRAMLGSLNEKPSRFEGGFLFEQWFIQEVFRMNAYLQKGWRLSFWKTSHGAEVDLIIENRSRIVFAIECKYKSRLSTPDLSGLHAFQATHPNVPCYVVAPIDHPLRFGTIQALAPETMIRRIFTEKSSGRSRA